MQKAGTTALRSFLRQHSDIYMPASEGHFFDHNNFMFDSDGNYIINTKTPYHQYHLLFKNKKQAILGECTPVYIYLPWCMQRIQKYNPNIKLIVLLRNPVERAYSHYQMEKSRGNETLSTFRTALSQEQYRININLLYRRYFSYVSRGFYAKQLKVIHSLFFINNILCIKSEDLYNNHDLILASIFKFIGVKYVNIPQTLENKQDYSPINKEDKKYLIDIFRNDIHELEKLLKWDCSDWL